MALSICGEAERKLSGLGRVVLKARNKQRTAFYPTDELRAYLPETV